MFKPVLKNPSLQGVWEKWVSGLFWCTPSWRESPVKVSRMTGKICWREIFWWYILEVKQYTGSKQGIMYTLYRLRTTGCPKKHGNSVTNSISSLLWISIVIPNFKSLNIVMSARVYFMKRVKDCYDVSLMSPQDEQWWRTSLLYCILQFSCFTKYNRIAVKT